MTSLSQNLTLGLCYTAYLGHQFITKDIVASSFSCARLYVCMLGTCTDGGRNDARLFEQYINFARKYLDK